MIKGDHDAVAYLRCSKKHQELGPQAQRAAIEQFAERQGLRIVAWREDTGRQGARSGALPAERRPGLKRALEDLDSGRAGVLLVDVRDRLSRDASEAMRIRRHLGKKGARLLSACGVANGSSDQDIFIQDILFVVAEAEWRRDSARIRAAFAVKRRKGETVGGEPPFGLCRRGQKLAVNPDEERVLWAIASLRRRGFGYTSTGKELARFGIFSRSGKALDPASVRRICQRLSIVAQGCPEGPFPLRHVELARPLVWQVYSRALREAERIHPARSRASENPRAAMTSRAFDRLNGLEQQAGGC